MRQLILALLAVSLLSCGPTESPQETPPAAPESIEALTPSPHLEDDLMRASEHSISLWLAQNIRLAATSHSIPLPIAFALVSAESDFTIRAESWAGARGLIQVMPETARLHCSLEPPELYIPDLNLNCGFSYLAMMYSHFGDWRLALMAYHRGPTRLSYELANDYGHGTSVRYASGILSGASLD